MLNLTKEEMKHYVETKLPVSDIIEAKKIGNTIAVQGTIGQELITFEVNSEGNEYIERVDIIELDPRTNEPGWILTKTGSDNRPILNTFGHPNQYIIEDSIFKSMYEPSLDGPGLYSKSQIEQFIKADDDITFETEDDEMIVNAGGYIKVTDLDKISCISKVSFEETYAVINNQNKSNKKQQ